MFGIGEVALVAVVLVGIGAFRRAGRARGDDGGLARSVRELQDQLHATQNELQVQQRQVEELAERVDFTERRLAQAAPARQLPPTGGA
jgi:hypothetical protein